MGDNMFLFILEIILIVIGFVLIFVIKDSDPNKKTYTNVGIAGVVLGSVGMFIHILSKYLFR
jgi:hypothetical protein